MTILLIEDETPVANQLVKLILECSSQINVIGIVKTINEGIEVLFRDKEKIDLIISDIQLSDGLSFEIFRETNINIPVIFVTAYDQFLFEAFETIGIDYLLKPIKKEKLEKALSKYNQLQRHFSVATNNLIELITKRDINAKKRLIVKKGIENISLKFEDVALFYTDHRILFVIDKTGKKYTTDGTISEMEKRVDCNIFFRITRQTIVNIDYVKSYKVISRVKLQVFLNIPDFDQGITMSYASGQIFKKWLERT